MPKGKIEINDLADFNMEVVVTGQFFVREWIALKLIRLAAWVMRCGITYEEIDED